MPSITDKRIFTKEWNEEQHCWFLVVDQSISIPKRRELTRYVSETLQQPRLLTFTELESCLFSEPEPNTIYWYKLPEGRRHPALFVFTEEWLHYHGLLEEFNRLQELLLVNTYQISLAEICGKGDKAYQYGVSFQPGGGPQRAQLTKTARKEDKINGSGINYRLLDFCNKVASIGLQELASAARRHENLKHASLIPGPKGSDIFTNQQQNFASIGANLADEIGKLGDPHPDPDDDITSLTIMLNMPNLPLAEHKGQVINKYHGGRFVVPALKAAITMRPRSMVGFSATFLHFALSILEYPVPENSPMRLPPSLPHLPPSLVHTKGGPKYSFVRLTIHIYTDVKMKYLTFGQFNVEVFTRKVGIALFSGPESRHDWMTNFFMVFEEIKYAIVSPNPDFDRLKRDLETLSCGKKFLNKSGGASAKWVEYETNWDIAEEGVSGNPNWTKESLPGIDLEDLVHEAENVFSARKIKAIQETAQQLEDDNDVEDDNNEERSEAEESEEDEEMDG